MQPVGPKGTASTLGGVIGGMVQPDADSSTTKSQKFLTPSQLLSSLAMPEAGTDQATQRTPEGHIDGHIDGSAKPKLVGNSGMENAPCIEEKGNENAEPLFVDQNRMMEEKEVQKDTPSKGTSSAQNTGIPHTAALQLIHRYCGQLKVGGKVVQEQAVYTIVEIPPNPVEKTNLMFRCTVQMPSASALSSAEGSVMSSKLVAKQDAARKACELLHDLGELDAQGNPVPVLPEASGNGSATKNGNSISAKNANESKGSASKGKANANANVNKPESGSGAASWKRASPMSPAAEIVDARAADRKANTNGSKSSDRSSDKTSDKTSDRRGIPSVEGTERRANPNAEGSDSKGKASVSTEGIDGNWSRGTRLAGKPKQANVVSSASSGNGAVKGAVKGSAKLRDALRVVAQAKKDGVVARTVKAILKAKTGRPHQDTMPIAGVSLNDRYDIFQDLEELEEYVPKEGEVLWLPDDDDFDDDYVEDDDKDDVIVYEDDTSEDESLVVSDEDIWRTVPDEDVWTEVPDERTRRLRSYMFPKDVFPFYQTSTPGEDAESSTKQIDKVTAYVHEINSAKGFTGFMLVSTWKIAFWYDLPQLLISSSGRESRHTINLLGEVTLTLEELCNMSNYHDALMSSVLPSPNLYQLCPTLYCRRTEGDELGGDADGDDAESDDTSKTKTNAFDYSALMVVPAVRLAGGMVPSQLVPEGKNGTDDAWLADMVDYTEMARVVREHADLRGRTLLSVVQSELSEVEAQLVAPEQPKQPTGSDNPISPLMKLFSALYSKQPMLPVLSRDGLSAASLETSLHATNTTKLLAAKNVLVSAQMRRMTMVRWLETSNLRNILITIRGTPYMRMDEFMASCGIVPDSFGGDAYHVVLTTYIATKPKTASECRGDSLNPGNIHLHSRKMVTKHTKEVFTDRFYRVLLQHAVAKPDKKSEAEANHISGAGDSTTESSGESDRTAKKSVLSDDDKLGVSRGAYVGGDNVSESDDVCLEQIERGVTVWTRESLLADVPDPDEHAPKVTLRKGEYAALCAEVVLDFAHKQDVYGCIHTPQELFTHPISVQSMHTAMDFPLLLWLTEGTMLASHCMETLVPTFPNVNQPGSDKNKRLAICDTPVSDDEDSTDNDVDNDIEDAYEEFDCLSFTYALAAPQTQLVHDYRRLECLGDSLLKLLSTLYIVINYQHYDEGSMSKARSHIICNKHLSETACKLHIPRYLWCETYQIRRSLPMRLQTECIEKTISDKQLADVIESILGAYYIHIRYRYEKGMEPFAEMPSESPEKEVPVDAAMASSSPLASQSQKRKGSPYLGECWKGVMVQMGVVPKDAVLPNVTEYISDATRLRTADSEHLMEENASSVELRESLNTLQKVLGYKFSDESLLIEAITHSSYLPTKKAGTVEGALLLRPDRSCFERLEFLGDALIDFVVTNYLFNYPRVKGPWTEREKSFEAEALPTNPEDPACSLLSPGAITSFRCFAVNNKRFSLIAAYYRLHQHIFFNSTALTEDMENINKSLEGRSLEELMHAINQSIVKDDVTLQHGADVIAAMSSAGPEVSEGADLMNAPSSTFPFGIASTKKRSGATSLLADVFEAITAAIFIDAEGDMGTIENLMHNWVIGPVLVPALKDYERLRREKREAEAVALRTETSLWAGFIDTQGRTDDSPDDGVKLTPGELELAAKWTPDKHPVSIFNEVISLIDCKCVEYDVDQTEDDLKVCNIIVHPERVKAELQAEEERVREEGESEAATELRKQDFMYLPARLAVKGVGPNKKEAKKNATHRLLGGNPIGYFTLLRDEVCTCGGQGRMKSKYQKNGGIALPNIPALPK